MHDTCATANKAACLISKRIEEVGRDALGEEAWQALPEGERQVLDGVCYNHTRCLPVAAFNRRHRRWLRLKFAGCGEHLKKVSYFTFVSFLGCCYFLLVRSPTIVCLYFFACCI